MPYQTAHYGWIPDLPDQRDFQYAAPVEMLGVLPASVDLTSACPPVYDQGQLGSCTANAIAGAIEFDQIKQNLSPIFVPSRLFIYYNERVMEGTVSSDSGAQIRDGMKSVGQQGACPEDMWPYHIAHFADKPTDACFQEALKHKAILYQRVVRNLIQMKGCLASGYPFIFGFTVYESFESNKMTQTGHALMPQAGEHVLGGQAVMAIGYDDSHKWFIVRNSWGTGWGMQGYFTLPYDYLMDSSLANDFWTLRHVE
jgi:C1A family cysteine protease